MTLWLSSWPRSGNTLLRQVLYSGWGVISGSLYPEDFGDNHALIRACGHVELARMPQGEAQVLLNPHGLPVKTHNLPHSPDDRAVYLIRDGRAACVSLWQFWRREVPLEAIVRGQTQFGTWSDNVLAWTAGARVETLLRYEQMVRRPAEMVAALTGRFGQPTGDPLAPLHGRAQLAAQDGTWVRPAGDWRSHWSEQLEDLFQRCNAPAFSRFYAEDLPAAPGLAA